MIRQIRSYPKVTLLFAAKDIEHNNAEALKEYCEHIMPENWLNFSVSGYQSAGKRII